MLTSPWGGTIPLLIGGTIDENTKSIVLMKYRPMIEEFRQAISEERKRGASDARIEMMLEYIETKNASVEPSNISPIVVDFGGRWEC